MPRSKPRLGSLPTQALTAANSRLQRLEKAGLTQDKLDTLLAKIVTHVELILDDPHADPFARIAAAKMLARDIIAIAPSKTTSGERVAQTPVTIVLPEWTMRPPRSPAPRAIGRSSTPSAAQVPADTDL